MLEHGFSLYNCVVMDGKEISRKRSCTTKEERALFLQLQREKSQRRFLFSQLASHAPQESPITVVRGQNLVPQ